MKKSIFLVKSLMAFSILFVSCDDDNEIKCPDALTGELSTIETDLTGTWVLSDIVSEDAIDLTDDDTDNASMDLYTQYTECQKDISYEFDADRSYAFLAGKSVADCDNEQESVGTWGLSATSVLTVVSNCSSQVTNIEVNDDSTAFTTNGNIQYVDVNGDVVISETTFTYSKVE